MWDLIVSVSDHCLSFYFAQTMISIQNLDFILPESSAFDFFIHRGMTQKQ